MKDKGKQSLDLKTFKFPEVGVIDTIISTFNTIPELLAEARSRGFYRGNTKYNTIFSKIFFEGCKKFIFKKNISEEFKKSAYKYFVSFIRSWNPKHEEKEAICAMILSEICERIE